MPNMLKSSVNCSNYNYNASLRPNAYHSERVPIGRRRAERTPSGHESALHCQNESAQFGARRHRPRSCATRAAAMLAEPRSSGSVRSSHHVLLENNWFQNAIREIAKRVSDGVPFMELVELQRPWSGRDEEATFSSFRIGQSVMDTPELWKGIAEALSGRNPDVVILCKRVDAAHLASQHGAPSERKRSAADEVERACRSLVDTGIARSVLTGHVGDCCPHAPTCECAGDWEAAAEQEPAARARGGSGLFACQQQDVNYWGLVVQSRTHATGTEGCYLLKTVRNVEPCTNCSCVFYSLTRVCQGEGLESQFIRSWLTR